MCFVLVYPPLLPPPLEEPTPRDPPPRLPLLLAPLEDLPPLNDLPRLEDDLVDRELLRLVLDRFTLRLDVPLEFLLTVLDLRLVDVFEEFEFLLDTVDDLLTVLEFPRLENVVFLLVSEEPRLPKVLLYAPRLPYL